MSYVVPCPQDIPLKLTVKYNLCSLPVMLLDFLFQFIMLSVQVSCGVQSHSLHIFTLGEFPCAQFRERTTDDTIGEHREEFL